jgi:hypothetical protein
MVFGLIARGVGTIAKAVIPKVLPKVAEFGLKSVAGKAAPEVASTLFKKIGGEAGEAGGKKLLKEVFEKALKGDKGSISQLSGFSKDLFKIPGMQSGIIKTLFEGSGLPFGRAAGSLVSKLVGIGKGSAISPTESNL